MKKIVTLSLCILLFLISCNDVSDFLFETDQTIQIRSIDNGSLFKGGEAFPVTIYFDGAVIPEEMSVAVFDDQGVSWGETLIPIPLVEDEYITSLIIPNDLPQGKYTFHIRVFENEQELLFEEVVLFKTDDDFSIDQLFSLPHETQPGKDVLIKAEVRAPGNVDPFLRWTLDNTILKEGYLSEGLDTLHWIASEVNGLYKIRLEIFPESCDSSFLSSVFSETEIVVTDQPLIEKNKLTPSDDYSLLFHFSGDYLPEDDSAFETTVSGELQIETINNNLGYSFSDNNGLLVMGDIIPQDQGKITPFSINGRIALLNELKGGNLLSIAEDSKPLLSLAINDFGNLVFTFLGHESVSLFSINELTDFTVHVIPIDDSVEIHWYFNGNNGGHDTFENFERFISEDQLASIGGNDDFISADLFIDELGIFSGQNETSSIDSNQFYRVKNYILGESLISAEGYDDINRYKFLKPDSKTLLSTFSQSVNNTEIILSFPVVENEEDWKATLENEEGEVLFQFLNNGVITEIDTDTGLISNKARLSMLFNEGSIDFVMQDNGALNRNVSGVNPGDKFSLFLETNVENKNDTLLDFYIIFTKDDSLNEELIVTTEDEESLL